jgi:hypothetical protein
MGTRAEPWANPAFALKQIENAGKDSRVAVLVAGGTYTGETVVMRSHVDLYGGYSPESWERDIFQFGTVLDGGNIRRVVVGAGQARIDGFVITRGLARSHGGGILCEDTSPVISNNRIVGNAVLEPDRFRHDRIHQEGHHGGGIACLYNTLPWIRNNLIAGNRTGVGNGGGLYIRGWVRIPDVSRPEIQRNRMEGEPRPRVENNVFVNNTAGENDFHSTRSSNGGAIACAYEAYPLIQNNVIAMNRAKGNGDGGGIYCEYYSDPEVAGNWICGNESVDDAGAFYTMRLGQPLITANVIAGNRTLRGGVGGIRISKEGRARITENWILFNRNGGVLCADSYMELEGNVIFKNTDDAGVIYGSHFSYFQPVLIRKNTILENEGGAFDIREYTGAEPRIEENRTRIDGKMGKGPLGRTALPGDGIRIRWIAMRYDPVTGTTILTLESPQEEKSGLAGRLIRLAETWSVIRNAEGNEVRVWGDLRNVAEENRECEILAGYGLR